MTKDERILAEYGNAMANRMNDLRCDDVDMVREYLENKKKLLFLQDGKEYSLYDLPPGFVIKCDIEIVNLNLMHLPDLSQIIIEGSFDCRGNQLVDLVGAPKKVLGKFDCSWNNLTSLKGAPKEVGGVFDCSFNQLTSLEGAPKAKKIISIVNPIQESNELKSQLKQASQSVKTASKADLKVVRTKRRIRD